LNVSIRPFERSDLRRISEIEAASFSDPWPTSFFIYVHGKSPDLFLVAEADGRVVGYILGEIREAMFSGYSERPKTGHVMNIAVDDKIRKRGVGTLLMDSIEGRFRERGASQVILEVRESNSTARTFYEMKGYEEIGKVRAYYPDEDAVIMRKRLV
jgi:ribosomal-protein-alanine N-acetyltransferase